MAGAASECKPEVMEAEDPLFLLYTSKGAQESPRVLSHSSAGYLPRGRHPQARLTTSPGSCSVAWQIGWITGAQLRGVGPWPMAAPHPV